MPYIYKIVNDINNKIYIGKTSFSIEKRWKEHCHDSVNRQEEKRPLYNAMNKYGVEHFHIEEIEKIQTDEEACEREIYWINYYDSYHNGYNATLGGNGRAYIDYDFIVELYKNYNILQIHQQTGIDEGTIRNILRIKNIPIKSSQDIAKEKAHKIDCYSLDGKFYKTFNNISEAASYIKPEYTNNYKKLSGVTAHIQQVCTGERKTAYRYKWQYHKD